MNMANGYYQFTYPSVATGAVTVQYSNDGTNWTDYNPPQNILTVNNGDSVYMNFVGPAGYSLTGDVITIVSRASNVPAATAQAYSPFSWRVYFPFTGSNSILLGTASSNNPGRGKKNNYEMTIAFGVTNDGGATVLYFSEDPEMDVEGN
jgi:hypothetical protein